MDRGETKASQGQDTAERNERGRERRREEEKNSTESAIPRPPAAEVEVSHMPLKTLLSPAALRDEASTFLLPLINATSQLVGYDTWRESRGPRQASAAGPRSSGAIAGAAGGSRDAAGGAEGDKSSSDV